MEKYNNRPYWSVEYDLLHERERILRAYDDGEIKTFEDAVKCGFNSTRLYNGNEQIASAYLDEQGNINIMESSIDEEKLLEMLVVIDNPVFDTDEDGFTIMCVKVKE